MMARLATLGWLVFIWVALRGSLSIAGLVAGVALSALLLWYFSPSPRTGEVVTLRPHYAIAFLGYFFVKFIEANLKVALAVLRPDRVRLTRAVIGVPIAAASETATMLLASAVSLTPGTFFMEVRRTPATMYVHVLELTTVRNARVSILEMERRINLAIGPPGAAAASAALQTRVAAGEFDQEGEP